MGKFINDLTGVVVSVSDEKDARFGEGWSNTDKPEKRGPGRPKKPVDEK
mgnify:FL=1